MRKFYGLVYNYISLDSKQPVSLWLVWVFRPKSYFFWGTRLSLPLFDRRTTYTWAFRKKIKVCFLTGVSQRSARVSPVSVSAVCPFMKYEWICQWVYEEISIFHLNSLQILMNPVYARVGRNITVDEKKQEIPVFREFSIWGNFRVKLEMNHWVPETKLKMLAYVCSLLDRSHVSVNFWWKQMIFSWSFDFWRSDFKLMNDNILLTSVTALLIQSTYLHHSFPSLSNWMFTLLMPQLHVLGLLCDMCCASYGNVNVTTDYSQLKLLEFHIGDERTKWL